MRPVGELEAANPLRIAGEIIGLVRDLFAERIGGGQPARGIEGAVAIEVEVKAKVGATECAIGRDENGWARAV